MSLINEQQKKNAGDDQSPVKIPVPKPAPASEPAPAPEQLTPSTPNPDYEPLEQAPIEFFEQPVKEALEQQNNGSPFNVADAIRPGASTEQRVPTAEIEDMTPFMPNVNIWEDVTANQTDGFQLNLPNDVATKRPTLFNPLQLPPNKAGAMAESVYDTTASNYLKRQAESDAATNAAISRAEQAVADKTTQLKNTPELDKPWHTTAWNSITGYFGDVLFGSESAQKETSGADPNKPARFNPLIGTFGRHGAGLGGAIKYGLSLPIGIFPTAYAGLANESIKRQQRKLEKENPAVNYKGTLVPFNTIPERDRYLRAAQKFNNSWVTNIAPSFYAEREFNLVKSVQDIITGQVISDDTNDANPYLQPWNDKSKAEPPKGFLFSKTRRPGQPFYTDGGLFLEVINQIASPANKIDVLGNAFGNAAGKVIGGVGKVVFGDRNFAKQADALLEATRPVKTTRAVLQTPPATVESATNVAGTRYKRVIDAPDTPVIGQLPPAPERAALPPARSPISEPIRIVGEVERNPFDDNAFDFSAEIPIREVERPPKKIDVTPFSQNVDEFSDEFVDFSEELPQPRVSVFREEAVIPDIFKQQPVIPRQGAADVIENVGVLQPGRTVEFTPTTLPRNHDDLVAFMKTGSEEQKAFIEGYRGESWADLEDFVRFKNPAREGELNSVGSILDSFPTTKPTLDDYIKQAHDLAATRNVIEQAKSPIERYFDKFVDFGRRAVDELPAKVLTPDDVEKTIAAGGKVNFAKGVLEDETIPQEVVEALSENDPTKIAEVVTPEVVEALVAKNNELLTPNTRIIEPKKGLRTVKPPASVFHGTAIADWSPDYNIVENGSRGIFGSGLYTTEFMKKAGDYAGAFTGENASVISKSKPLAPAVVELNTDAFVATLGAETLLTKDIVKSFAEAFPDAKIPVGKRKRLNTITSLIERSLKKNAGERDLQRAYGKVSEVLRTAGYDSVYSKKTGDFVALDNGKLKVQKKFNLELPKSEQAMDAAVKRFNVDSAEAAANPTHLTAASNLADSQAKLLNQMSAQVDDKLAEVQEKAVEMIAKKEPEPVTAVKATIERKTVLTNNIGEGGVENAAALLKTYKNAIELPIVLKDNDRWVVYGNRHTLEAAKQSRKRTLDVVVRNPNGSSKIERVNLKDLKNISYADTQETLPTTLKQAKRMLERDGMLEFPPVYKENSKGDLITIKGYEFVSEAATSAGKPYDAVVITKGKAKLVTIDGEDVIARPVEQVAKPSSTRKAPAKKKTKAKAKAKPETKAPEPDVDEFADEFADDYIPTDEEIMKMSEYDDFAEEAQFNPEDFVDDLLDSIGDGTICRY
jgi:hypothetical protein